MKEILEKASDQTLLELCIDNGGQDLFEKIVLYSNLLIPNEIANFPGQWASYDFDTIYNLASGGSLLKFSDAIILLHKELGKARDQEKAFRLVVISPQEVSFELFSRQKGLKFLEQKMQNAAA
jgi:hypothetical protein